MRIGTGLIKPDFAGVVVELSWASLASADASSAEDMLLISSSRPSGLLRWTSVPMIGRLDGAINKGSAFLDVCMLSC